MFDQLKKRSPKGSVIGGWQAHILPREEDNKFEVLGRIWGLTADGIAYVLFHGLAGFASGHLALVRPLGDINSDRFAGFSSAYHVRRIVRRCQLPRANTLSGELRIGQKKGFEDGRFFVILIALHHQNQRLAIPLTRYF
jgi:hypothetical protein